MAKKFFYILCVFVFANLLQSTIKAEVVTDYTYTVTINEDSSALLDILIDLKNDSSSSLISSYTIDIPYKATSVVAKINSTSVTSLIEDIENGSRIKIDFLRNSIFAGQSATLEMNVAVSNAVVNIYQAKKLILPYPESNFNYQYVKTSISFPESFGGISYSSDPYFELDQVESGRVLVNFEQTSPLTVLWGNPNIGISFNTLIENRKNSINHTLSVLIPSYRNQSVEYLNVYRADYALADSYNNLFGFVTLNPLSNLELKLDANVKIEPLQNINPVKYSWGLDLNSVLGQKIYSKLNQGNSNPEKLKLLNEYLFTEFQLDSNKFTSETLNNLWNNSSDSLNSLQYCYLIVSSANYLGLNSSINYGYKIFGQEGLESPTIWCNVEVDSQILSFDFQHQEELGYILVTDSQSDRVSMGVWHPDQFYNDMLGILSDSPLLARLGDPFESIALTQNNPTLKVNIPEKVYSGEFYKASLVIENPTNQILKINQLFFNQENVIDRVKVGDLYKAVMPLQTNSISVDYLRESDFILNLSKNVKFDLQLNDINLTESKTVKFEPDYKLILIFFALVLLCFSTLGFILFKVYKRKRAL